MATTRTRRWRDALARLADVDDLDVDAINNGFPFEPVSELYREVIDIFASPEAHILLGDDQREAADVCGGVLRSERCRRDCRGRRVFVRRGRYPKPRTIS